MPQWICCQIGAREHYSIPHTLHTHQSLLYLLTDAWVPPRSPLHRIQYRGLRSLQERFTLELANANVKSFTNQLLLFEAQKRLNPADPWQHTIARNTWFQKQVRNLLSKLALQLLANKSPILFAYSYAALEQFRFAKEQGWQTILGQIDPGVVESNMIYAEHARYPNLAPNITSPPITYWKQWHKECQLADHIVVNSSWSKRALEEFGIPASKLHIVPLAYQVRSNLYKFHRTYPAQFTYDRPLRVLFLGQIILRKGLAAIIEAAKNLCDFPIEFCMVGSIGINKLKFSNLHWIGPVSRSQVAQYYQNSDVFLFPTLSDGFGLTQLEAQAWRLPIIASQNCGEVVQDRINGCLLPEVSGEAISTALLYFLKNPDQLMKYSEASAIDEKFSLNSLHKNLQNLIYAPI